MKIEKRRNFFIGLGILCIAILFLVVLLLQRREPLLVVSFLNIGQGDAIFIEAPNGNQVLVDAGPDGNVVRELGKVMPFWDRTIDMILPTHGDKDHIGGFPEVLKRFKIRSIYDSPNSATTSIYEAFEEAKEQEDVPIKMAFSSDTIVLDEKNNVYMRVLFPDQTIEGLERNDGSTVVQLVYGDTEFMLTGDAGMMIEEYLVYLYGDYLESEVLKAGHHGSRTSSSALFLDTVNPKFFVISAGEDNSYGHPHPEVLDTVNQQGVKVRETKYGTVRFASDGKDVFEIQ